MMMKLAYLSRHFYGEDEESGYRDNYIMISVNTFVEDLEVHKSQTIKYYHIKLGMKNFAMPSTNHTLVQYARCPFDINYGI